MGKGNDDPILSVATAIKHKQIIFQGGKEACPL